jgi:hypothetical protein
MTGMIIQFQKKRCYKPEGTLRVIMTSCQVTCVLYNQRDATYTIFFIIISAVHILGGFYAHPHELIKFYVRPWVLLRFPAVYRWCGWVGTGTFIFF